VTVLRNRYEYTWLTSLLPPLSCYCADHSQLSHHALTSIKWCWLLLCLREWVPLQIFSVMLTNTFVFYYKYTFFSYSESWPVKMWPIRCPETSVSNYHTTPCNYPEDYRFHTFFFLKFWGYFTFLLITCIFYNLFGPNRCWTLKRDSEVRDSVFQSQLITNIGTVSHFLEQYQPLDMVSKANKCTQLLLSHQINALFIIKNTI
jgi:hypothetical protein